MSLLVTRVLGDEVEVLSSDNQSSVHLGGNDGAVQDTAADRDEASERALLVCMACQHLSLATGRRYSQWHLRPSLLSFHCPFSRPAFPQLSCKSPPSNGNPSSLARTDVAALNGGLGGAETQTNVLVPSSSALAGSGALGLGLGVQEDVRLLLESTLALDGQLGRPEDIVSAIEAC